jgi:hypothetical protein
VSGEIERDAWLDAALRHAPDAELGPSPRLRAEILRQAHEAAQPRSAWLNPLQWLDALAARPGLGAGLAGVFVATIAVVLWSPWSPTPEAEQVAAAPAEAASAAVTTPATVTPAAPPATVSIAAAPAPAPARDAAKATESKRERAAARTEVAVAAPPPMPAAVPAPAPARAAEAASSETAERRAGNAVAEQTVGAAAPATLAKAAPRGRPEDLAPLAAPRRGLRTEPDVWTWQRGGNPPEPVNDALRQWLDKLDTATAGRWEVIEADPAGVRALATLTLLREERVHTIVRLESDGVSRRGTVRVRASLDPAAATALAAELRALSP